MSSAMENPPREVLLYGMSANPPTGMQGHMGAVSFCRALFDEIWLLPVYQHIYSSKRNLAPFEHRINMCRLAITAASADVGGDASDAAQIYVKEIEREVFEHHAANANDGADPIRVGSIDVIRYLTDKFPGTSFTMLLGADTYADLCAGKWKDGDELQRLVKLLVMARKGYAEPAVEDAAGGNDRVRFVTVPSLGDVSSTQARSVKDADVLGQLVAPSVAAYIVEHKLYAFTE